MNIEELYTYCLSLKGVETKMPFDDKVLVFAVKGKMFCLKDIETGTFILVKCDPEKAIELREEYSGVQPGYHMNKRHWNAIYLDAGLSDKLIMEWIKDSYDLVVAGLTKKQKQELCEETA